MVDNLYGKLEFTCIVIDTFLIGIHIRLDLILLPGSRKFKEKCLDNHLDIDIPFLRYVVLHIHDSICFILFTFTKIVVDQHASNHSSQQLTNELFSNQLSGNSDCAVGVSPV